MSKARDLANLATSAAVDIEALKVEDIMDSK